MVTAIVLTLATFESTAMDDTALRVALETRAAALEAVISASGDGSLERFIDKHLSGAFRASLEPNVLLDRLKRIRSTCARAGAMEFRPVGRTGIRLTCGGHNTFHAVDLHVEPTPPYRTISLG